ncbi:MAG: ChbG/HpnK family deacetylase [Proteobacteria bacterium]|nr:ChbG/HpnK family deacetylase [Pseudomonadota bacterium]
MNAAPVNMAPPRRVALCADDFGASAGASLAILDLARLGAISSTTCLVHAPFIDQFARSLRGLAPDVSIGLHLDLTEFAPASQRDSLRRWLLHGFLLRNISQTRVLDGIRRQLDRFEELFGQAPAFVDGHQHVHQIPGIREPLLEELQQRHGRSVAIRSTCTRGPHGFKGWLIEGLGGRSLRTLVELRALSANTDFAGAYDLRSMSTFSQSMHHWLRTIANGGLIMCHPELPRKRRLPANARQAEYCFLASPAWPELRASLNIQLQPFTAS